VKTPAFNLAHPRVAHRPAARNRSGFTLIEIAACLVILGLLTGAAALSLRSIKHNVDLDTWVERFAQLDRQTRQRAQDQGRPWRIVIDLQQNRLWSEPSESNPHGIPRSTRSTRNTSTTRTTLLLPRSWALTEARTDNEQADLSSSAPRQVVVTISSQGVSPTYAIGLTHTTLPSSLSLLVAGGSGQPLRISDVQQIKDIFASLRAARDDAG